MSRSWEPLPPDPWQDDAIGIFAGVVNEDGSGIVPYAGPSPLVVDPRALPPPGTEVVYTAFTPRNPRRRSFHARNVRSAK